MTEVFNQAMTLIISLGVIAVAIVYVRSQIIKVQKTELAELAKTRGDHINDLERHIEDLEKRLSNMEGQMAALQALKAQEIAVEVARLLGKDWDL